jgi:hypothetical protein
MNKNGRQRKDHVLSADWPLIPYCGCHTGKAVLWYCHVLPLALYAVVVLLAPPDVLDRLPWAKRVADGIHDWVLSMRSLFDIYKHAKTTVFPQVAMLASALGTLVAAIMALAMILHSNFLFGRIRAKHASRPLPSAKDWFGGTAALPIVSLFCFWAHGRSRKVPLYQHGQSG